MESNITHDLTDRQTDRQTGVDALKTIAAFLVVCIHQPFPGIIGEYIVAVARIAVPIFFMVSGYFYPTLCKKEKGIRKILNSLKLVLFSNLLYCLWQVYANYRVGTLGEFLGNTFSFKMLVKVILFNVSPFSGHLWYLNALLYVYVIIFLLDAKDKRRLLYYLTPGLLLCDLIFGKYSLIIFHHEIPYIVVRNFMFVGLPYFAIGCLIKEKNPGQGKSTNVVVQRIFVLVFLILNIVERMMLVYYKVNGARDHYISTTFLAVSAIVLALNYKGHNSIITGLANVGEKYSGSLYIIHPIWLQIFDYYVHTSLLDYISPIIIFILSLFTVLVWHHLFVCKCRWKDERME